MTRLLAFLIAFGLTVGIMAQPPVVPPHRNIALGANYRAGDSALVNAMSVGLLCNSDSLRGFQVGALTSVVRRETQGLNLGGLFALSLGDATGLQVAGLTNAVDGRMHGFQLAGVSNVAGEVQGVQIGGMSNISRRALHDIQLSGVSNISMGVNLGTQASLVGKAARV